MGVWEEVAMDSLLARARHALLCPAGGPSLQQPYGCFIAPSQGGWPVAVSTPLHTPSHMPMDMNIS
jgi:hypothetical protein